ncbi:cell 5A endo-1,4-betaglucanase [Achlya hypogyna]|uniref:Cell 5A endo-1,4-betaglucanase n=1 Tax=Achlya hypogyna TaxID=1202772 RepID=A0A1V9YSN8_ACHHY|nr:cell 5A endo-1,4-betaglucanase [Achlya hypogyna]
MATSPRGPSPRLRIDVDEDAGGRRGSSSPSTYKRYESGAVDDDDGTFEDSEATEGSNVQQLDGYKQTSRRGRLWAWRRRILVILVVAGCIAIVVIFILKLTVKNSSSNTSDGSSESSKAVPRGIIRDGLPDGPVDLAVGTNPTAYPPQRCKLPNYVSQDGKIYITGSNGFKQPIGIKGINWSGMETGNAIPYGLWTNTQNGTTVYEIASFLARNNFNSVRLPLCIESILKNRVPNTALLNTYSNRAINAKSYLTMISSLVKALAYRGISILLDLHVLSVSDPGPKWTSATIGQASYLAAVDALTKTFCNDDHWNIIGLDLKNAPSQMTWGDKTDTDWAVAAALIGNRMLGGCPNWLAFVEGVNAQHTMTLPNGVFASYYDWWGAGLQEVANYPLALETANKIVYAPHYYSPSVYPQKYLLANGTRVGDLIGAYTELDNATLKEVVFATADNMFGYLAKAEQAAIVLGEFGGLYTQDKHANYTVRRVIESCIAMVQQPGFAGGYVWSLNPESGYNYNPSDHVGLWQEGLIGPDWVSVNKPYLNALRELDNVPHLARWPCLS